MQKKSEKSLEPFLGKLCHQPTNQLTYEILKCLILG